MLAADVIESWNAVDDISKMPKVQLCSYCYGAKLRTMQQSPYSVYDESYEERLKYVAKGELIWFWFSVAIPVANNQNIVCGTSPVSTAPKPGEIMINSTLPILCKPEQIYTTRAGDTCDSIAVAKKVSAATLYHTNSNIPSCNSISPGLSICLPPSCKSTYSVGLNETCVAIAVAQGTTWMNIVSWNAGLDLLCSNIADSNPTWGSTICVTPPGGGFENSPGEPTLPGNGNTGGHGGAGNGYSEDQVNPPVGALVAKDTTKQCGQYIQASLGDDCARMILPAVVPMDLFIQVNPSLVSAYICTSKLQPGAWYCLHPSRSWTGSGG